MPTIERVRAYLAERGVAERILEFDVSSATVELAAKAAGVEPCRIAKSLTFLVGDVPTIVVFAGDARIANPKFKAQFHCKATMLSPQQVVDLIGHEVGGVCPFALKPGVQVWLDESLRRFETVFPACGSSNSAAEFTPEELYKYSGSIGWVDIAKLPE